MINEEDFNVSNTIFTFKKDEYPLSKIKGARVKTNTFQDHALRIAAFFKVVVIIRLFIKQLLSLDLDVRHQLAYSS
ncbi:hypothetical protein [Vibrio vulnificus]|uniref:hypothetical protein n=1 Tax=Vibrio vulnificus TaxID=672 RepID=UPI003ED9A668